MVTDDEVTTALAIYDDVLTLLDQGALMTTSTGTSTPADLPVLDHWIDGAASAGISDRLGDVFDPARGVVQKHVRLASAGDVDTAVAVARKAFSSWGQASIAKRQSVMFAFRELLERAARASSPRSSPPSTARCSPTPAARSPAGSRSSSSPARCRT